MQTFTQDELTGWLQKNMGYSYFGAKVMSDFLFKAKQQWPQKSKKGKLSIHKRRKASIAKESRKDYLDPEGNREFGIYGGK